MQHCLHAYIKENVTLPIMISQRRSAVFQNMAPKAASKSLLMRKGLFLENQIYNCVAQKNNGALKLHSKQK